MEEGRHRQTEDIYSFLMLLSAGVSLPSSSLFPEGKEKEGMIGGGGSRVLIFLYLFFLKRKKVRDRENPPPAIPSLIKGRLYRRLFLFQEERKNSGPTFFL